MKHPLLAARLILWVVALVLLGGVALPGVALAGAGAADEDDTVREQVLGLVDDLTSPEEAVREAATQQLAELGAGAVKYLREAQEDAAHPRRAKEAGDYLRGLRVRTHRIVDASWNSITDAKVVVRRGGGLEPVVLESNAMGNLTYPAPAGERALRGEAEFEVTHPDYGTMVCTGQLGRGSPILIMPVVLEGSTQYERAARGVVVDPEGNPLPGVRVECLGVVTSGSGGFSAQNNGGAVFTNEQGAFVYYATRRREAWNGPGLGRAQTHGVEVPPGSRYTLRLTPPEASGLWPWVQQVPMNEPQTITLPRPQVTGRLDIEGLDDPAAREAICQAIRGGRPRLSYIREGMPRELRLDPALLLEETKLLAGTYRLTHGDISYLHLEVAEGDRGDLTFQLPPEITFTGKVVDGITGEPIEGALVFGWRGSNRNSNLARLTDAQWDALQAMKPGESGEFTDHEALAPLRAMLNIRAATRTDADGVFTLVQPIDATFASIMAVDRDRLPFYRSNLFHIETDEAHCAAIDPLPLFQAARVLVTPEINHGHPSISYRWRYTEGEQPAWFGRLDQAVDPYVRDFYRSSWLSREADQPVFVPAGVELELVFEAPYAERWSIAYPQDAQRLEAGGVATLSEPITFEPCVQVRVRVLDTLGRPIEGVPVRKHRDEARAWSTAHNTDGGGYVDLFVGPDETGRFGITIRPMVTLEYDALDEPEAGHYTIRLNDEQARQALDLHH